MGQLKIFSTGRRPHSHLSLSGLYIYSREILPTNKQIYTGTSYISIMFTSLKATKGKKKFKHLPFHESKTIFGISIAQCVLSWSNDRSKFTELLTFFAF